MTVLESALRVLAAYRDHVDPDPQYVRELLRAADVPENVINLDDLAAEVVNREVELLKHKRSA